ncbi:MAG: hypothetical protein AVDCRST_MAG76-378 [uncultured Acidimicrobiales bacterium]|uniref:Uncharacterized protein n=1 Tax=uncultured Acidimicrobiales bacterium TaxID=310071 RepID=A0A6J4H5D4_9ACTN|nr:MAG: hypothetical protein AVDCRST_MAG76-378 [uncultured Acidimicrobiales bacterium]
MAVGVAAARASEGDRRAVTAAAPVESPQAQLAAAKDRATFRLVTLAGDLGGPETGLVTLYAAGNGGSGRDLGFDQVAVTSDGKRVHLWQTGSASLGSSGKDPVSIGTPVALGTSTWWHVTLDRPGGALNVLSMRTADGITISLDSTLDHASLMRIAERLAP